MVALCNRADHYIFILFLSSSFFFFFFSSPNLSGRRLDVYHTLAHGVALVRIQNAGLKCAVRGSLQIQDAKNRHLGTIPQVCWAISSQLRHVSTIGKNLVSINMSSTCPHNMVNFGPLRLRSVGEFGAPLQISTGFVFCLRYCSDVAHQRPTKLCTMFGRLLDWYTIYRVRHKKTTP